MAKAKTTTKRPTAAEKRKLRDILEKSVDAYHQGCEAGYCKAVQWIRDRERSPVSPVLGTGIQHVMLDYLEKHSKARGHVKKDFVRGEVAGFFSVIENPERAMLGRIATKRSQETKS